MAFLVGRTAVMASPGTVSAAPEPNKPIVLSVDDTFQAPNLPNRCGFDVWAHVFGTFTFKVQPIGVERDRIRFQHVFSGPGGSFAVNHIENVKYTVTTLLDGTLLETVMAKGTLHYHPVVPGHGSIGNNSGHEVLQFTWGYDEELGDYVLDDELSDADYAVICAQLA
jgi:hypothetical protein